MILAFDWDTTGASAALAILALILGYTLKTREWMRDKRIELYDGYVTAASTLADEQDRDFAVQPDDGELERARRAYDLARGRARLVATARCRTRILAIDIVLLRVHPSNADAWERSRIRFDGAVQDFFAAAQLDLGGPLHGLWIRVRDRLWRWRHQNPGRRRPPGP